MKTKITFIGAAHEVTGSCTLIEACGKKILIDCGMEQGRDIYENKPLPIAALSVDAICLTHAHIDHSGNIPALSAQGFKSPVYCTEATYRLCEIMLRDSAHIQQSEAEWKSRKSKRANGVPYTPPYTVEDADNALRLFVTHGYEEEFEICDGITATFFDAGHLLGSSSILLKINDGEKKTSILFSGDIGNIDRPLIRDPKKPPNADYVVMESTYGDRLHGERADYVGQLADVLQRTFDRGGNVVIPSFAVGRTQEMLYLCRIIKQLGLIRGHENFPVYVDSPMAIEATNIYSNGMEDYYDEEALDLLNKGIDPIKFPNLRTAVSSDESKAINENNEPKLIISASGMCEAGRIRHHLKHNLWRGECCILFVGYQVEGTLGNILLNGTDHVMLFGEEIAVKASIETMSGISGHADRDMLLGWLSSMSVPPKKVFVNHGNDRTCDVLAGLIRDNLNIRAEAPFSGDVYDLETGLIIEKGNPALVKKKSFSDSRADTAYKRLFAAGQRLMAVIEKKRGSSNKELAKFTSQIESLCEKYEQ